MLEYKTSAVRNEFGQLTGLTQFTVYLLALLHQLITGKPALATAFIDPAGGHDPNGLHPLGRAFDLRSRDLPAGQKQQFFAVARSIINFLGGSAVFEDQGRANEHFHFQV